MIPISRFNLFLSFLALFLLRFVIGFHFFHEGLTKVQDGDFDARYFLLAAKGPLAPMYHSMVTDHDGRMRLCRYPYTDYPDLDPQLSAEPVGSSYSLNPAATFSYWRQFLLDADAQYRFGRPDNPYGTPELEQRMQQARAQLSEKLRTLKSTDAASEIEFAETRRAYDDLVASMESLPGQAEAANRIIEHYEEKLNEFLTVNRDEILAYFQSQQRLEGFNQDGENRSNVAQGVQSLYGQLGTIQSDRQKKAAAWMTEVEQIWDGFEYEINALANDFQKANGTVALVRPYERDSSRLSWINRAIPWFDLVIGGLLMIGLFSRPASLLAAGFLGSVIASQPPWIYDAQPIFYQGIELVGLLVIFATCAGRYAGADYFTSWAWNGFFKDEPTTVEQEAA